MAICVFIGQKLGSALRIFSILLETGVCSVKKNLSAVICSRKNMCATMVGRREEATCFPPVLSLHLKSRAVSSGAAALPWAQSWCGWDSAALAAVLALKVQLGIYIAPVNSIIL